jgi:branched-chain amino acid transport system substrate-binding protein
MSFRKGWKQIGLLTAVVAITFAVAAMDGYGAEPFNYPKGVLKVGLEAPMTGTLASEGQEELHGATQAVEEINARGGLLGYKLQVVAGDVGSEFEPGTITSVIEKLITQDKVHAIVVGYASQNQFEIEICREYGIPLLLSADAMSTESIVGAAPEKYPTVWNIMPSYAVYQTELPKRMETWEKKGLIKLPSRKVAFITSDNAFSRYISDGLKENFKAIGWEITMDEMVAFGTVTEWGPLLSKIRANPPALIVNTDYIPSNEATFMEQFLENPTNTHIFMQYGPTTPEFRELLGAKGNGVLANLPYISATPKYKQGYEIRKRFEKRWGYEPGTKGPQVYAQVRIWADAVWRVGDPFDHLAVGKNIGEYTAFWGPDGLIVFDPKTHLVAPGYMATTFYQVWDGKLILVDPKAYAEGLLRMPPWWK